MRQAIANVSRLSWRVWQRDLDVYLTTWRTNFLPPLLEPVLYVLAFGLGLGSLIGEVTYQGRVVPYLEFMAPGVVSVAIMFWAYFETTYSSFVRMYFQRTFDAIIATPLLVEDVIWGRTRPPVHRTPVSRLAYGSLETLRTRGHAARGSSPFPTPPPTPTARRGTGIRLAYRPRLRFMFTR